jgi:hypothetical protein
MPETTTNKLPVACFAPPLTDELLAGYHELVDALDPSPVRDALTELLVCVDAWWELPVSTRSDVERLKIRHQGTLINVVITPLEAEQITALYDVTPWDYELDALSNPAPSQGGKPGLFDDLPEGDLRNAAFHLLWYAREITRDREPLTAETLG